MQLDVSSRFKSAYGRVLLQWSGGINHIKFSGELKMNSGQAPCFNAVT